MGSDWVLYSNPYTVIDKSVCILLVLFTSVCFSGGRVYCYVNQEILTFYVIHKRNGYLETNEEIRKDKVKQKMKHQTSKCEKRKQSRHKVREVRQSG